MFLILTEAVVAEIIYSGIIINSSSYPITSSNPPFPYITNRSRLKIKIYVVLMALSFRDQKVKFHYPNYSCSNGYGSSSRIRS